VLAAGAFIWGAMTSAIALSTSLRAAMVFAAVNGLGLALLVPCCQSLVADLHPPERRGRAFGLMQLTGALGGMAGSVFATNLGAADPAATWGLDGWRVAFHAVAAVSILTGGRQGEEGAARRRSPDGRGRPHAAGATGGGRPGAHNAGLVALTRPHPPCPPPPGILVLTLAVDPRRLPAPLAALPVPPAYVPLPPDDADDAPAGAPFDQACAKGGGGGGSGGGGALSPKPSRGGAAAHTHGAGWGEPLFGGERSPSPQLRLGAKASYYSGAGGGGGGGAGSSGHRTTHHEVLPPPAWAAGGGGGWDAEAGPRGPLLPGPAACSSSGKGRPRRRGLVADISWVLRIPTFQAIVLQVGGFGGWGLGWGFR
jgi:MFS family permease